MFTIDRKQENGLTKIGIINNHTQTRVEILPDHGALLHSFSVWLNGRDFNLIDNYSSGEELEATMTRSYKSAKLSPFPCRIREGKYDLNGKHYEFPNKFSDGSAIHGLLFNAPFELTDEFMTEQNACVTLEYRYEASDPGFPFNYHCTVIYKLLANDTLEIATTVRNLDEERIPVADGWHPYFRLGGRVDDWQIRFLSKKMLEFSDQLIPTGRFEEVKDFIEGRLIGDLKLDNCFLLEDHPSDEPVCVITNPENGLQFSFYVVTNYPYLQIYIPDDRKTMAIENLSAAPDCFNNHMGISLLRPEQSETFVLRYKPEIIGKLPA